MALVNRRRIETRSGEQRTESMGITVDDVEWVRMMWLRSKDEVDTRAKRRALVEAQTTQATQGM